MYKRSFEDKIVFKFLVDIMLGFKNVELSLAVVISL
jgi:hypothetical protein